jgi:hypothetical protein
MDRAGHDGPMKQLALITQGNADYDPRLKSLLEASEIDPHEFEGLDWFGLTPFFVLCGATVRPRAHTHGNDVHVEGVYIEIPEEFEASFFETLPVILDDAYGDEPD